MTNRPMSLVRALDLLARSHTRDDDLVGYTVSPSPTDYIATRHEYIEAWGVVRAALGMPVDPAYPVEPAGEEHGK